MNDELGLPLQGGMVNFGLLKHSTAGVNMSSPGTWTLGRWSRAVGCRLFLNKPQVCLLTYQNLAAGTLLSYCLPRMVSCIYMFFCSCNL